MYLNEVYTVTDTTLSLRYKFDYSEFTPFEKEKIATFENYDELRDYRSSHTYLSTFAENSTHLFFLTSDNEMNVWYRFMTSVLKNCCKYPEYSVILILFLILLPGYSCLRRLLYRNDLASVLEDVEIST